MPQLTAARSNLTDTQMKLSTQYQYKGGN